MTIAFVIVAMLAQAHQPPRDTRDVPGRGTGTIAGRVTSDETSPRPLRRAKVTINGHALSLGRTVITGDDGSFTFNNLPPGSFVLGAAKDAYVPMSFGATRTGRPGIPVTLAVGQTKRVSLRLARGAVITGTVLDVDGQPVQGIAVSALALRTIFGDVRYEPAGSPSLPTDDRGTYRIFGLPAGEYVVAALPQLRSTDLAGDRVRLTERANRTFALTRVFHPSSFDASGAARIAVRAGEERSGVDVQLRYMPLASLSGTAAAPADGSPAEVTIARTGETDASSSYRSTRADASGRFSFSNVPAGQYRIAARSVGPGGATSMAIGAVTIDGEDVENFVLSLQPTLTVSGLIVFRGDSGPPVFGTSRSEPMPLTSLLNRRASGTAQLEVDGVRFSIKGLVAGTLRMSGSLWGLRRPVGLSWWLQSIVAKGVELLDAPLDVTQNVDDAVAVYADRASEVSGQVASADGTPIRDAIVVAFSTDRSAWFFDSRRIASATSDRQGRYTIRNLPPGDYGILSPADIEVGEWFDPAILERLLPAATPLTIVGTEQKTVDLRPR